MVSSSMAALRPLLLVLVLCCPYATVATVRYPVTGGGGASCARLFSFGDSVTDAGNYLASLPRNVTALTLPFGSTFFGQPSGRFCDGRLIVDFIAEALRLPFPTPYLTGETAADFLHGANFAVAGATALNRSFFEGMGLDVRSIPPYSLDVQLGWLEHVLQLLKGSDKQESIKDTLSCSLFLLGIGVNDYNHLLLQNRSLTAEIRPLVPKVVAKVENAIKVLIGLGAKTIVVPGTIPMGCRPRFLAAFQSSSNPGDYDSDGCLERLNDLARLHNRMLRRMLRRVDDDDPAVTVIYGDYYGAVEEIIRNPAQHGFTKDGALTACCGDGGPYNSGAPFACNSTAVLCPDPARFISWDGIHLTEAAYRFVARAVLDGPYAQPPILSTCGR